MGFLSILLLLFSALSGWGLQSPGTTSNTQREEGKDEARLLSQIRQLTFEGRRAGEGYFSRDGSLFIFQSERQPENPFFQIYLLDLQSGETRRISPGHGKTTCAWIHPDGSKVLFASTHEDPKARAKQKEELAGRASGKTRRYSWDYDEYFEIYESGLAGTSLRKLTDAPGYDAEASSSPDGKLIVFASNRHAYTEKLSPQEQEIFERDPSYLVDLYLMNADGGQVRRLTQSKGYDGGPFFSPDGQRICWRRFSEDGARAEVYTMKIDGSDARQITHLAAMSWAPYFHPSGDYLIFTTNLHGFSNFELYLADTAGRSRPVRVTFSEGFDGLPAFSPDGRQLAWTSTRTAGGESQIFVAGWNDREARRLLGLTASIPELNTTVPEIAAEDLRLHVGTLASEAMEGRLTGTAGEIQATRYVAALFEALGLEPAGDNGTYFQNFEFTAGVALGSENRLSIQKSQTPTLREGTVGRDWRPLGFSRTGSFDPTPVVFAGYGMVAPAEINGFKEYDSYAHLDVSGKWVLVFRYLPEEIPPEERQHLARFSSLRYKAMVARERGALGLVVVSGPNSRVKEELAPLAGDASLGSTSLAAISVTGDLAAELLAGSEKTLKELQGQLDRGEAVMGFEIPDTRLEVTVDVEQQKRTGRNVLAYLRWGRDGLPSIALGAHADHLGRGEHMGSLARPGEKGLVHYGADDNASGLAALLEIAQYLVHQRAAGRLTMKRDLLLAAWSGEELGLLGSSHFTGAAAGEEQTDLSSRVAAYLNLDMVGRLGKALILQGVGSSSIWAGEIERRNIPLGLPIRTQQESYLPTDATSFYSRGVPVLSAFTGAHQDYHTPRDTADRINYEGLVRIARLMTGITRSLLARQEAIDYIEMAKPDRMPGRAQLRAFLGTIPDYSQPETAGVKLSGVIKGGPADQIGLQAGDIIVELAGRKIENIYDYTYAIEALKVDEPVTIQVLRRGERLSLTIKPSSRE